MKKKYKTKQTKYGTGRGTKKYKKWREQLLLRSKGKCENCGTEHSKLHCHHIKSWENHEELRHDVDNGEVLCPSCHCKKGLINKEILPGVHLKGKPSWNKGLKMKPETREKMRLANLGKKSWNKGLLMNEDQKKKISETKKGIPWTKARWDAQNLRGI